MKKENPFCKACEEPDCLISHGADCAMIKLYKEAKASKRAEAAHMLLNTASVKTSSQDRGLVAACQQLVAEGPLDHLPATERPVRMPERFRANSRTQEALSNFR